jgi:hypothetical protein
VNLHEWNEPTKRAMDFMSIALAGVSGGVAAVTLSQIALVVTIIAGLLSILWYAVRLHDRFRYGGKSSD